MLVPVLGLVLASAPASPNPTPAPSTVVESEAPAEYDATAAAADVELVLHDRGMDYLRARERLESNPGPAATAITARLNAVPSPGPGKRERLLAVLATLKQAEHVPLFAKELRAALLAKRSEQPWLDLLAKQGSAGLAALTQLAADREFPVLARAKLIRAIVEHAPPTDAAALSSLVGKGDRELDGELRRALTQRAQHDKAAFTAIAAGLERASESAAPDQRAALLIVRSNIGQASGAWIDKLEQLASDDTSAFVVRVAAIDGLAELGVGANALEAIAHRHGQPTTRSQQASEILAALALEALETLQAPQARAVADDLDLRRAEEPRLAALGYRLSGLESSPDWLEESQKNTWPQVRQAALARVTSPCAPSTVRTITMGLRPQSRGGETDRRVGKAAISALGRCGDERSYRHLQDVIEESGLDRSLRAHAARTLLVSGAPGAQDYLVGLIAKSHFPEISPQLISALTEAPSLSSSQLRTVCNVAAEAREMLKLQHPPAQDYARQLLSATGAALKKHGGRAACSAEP